MEIKEAIKHLKESAKVNFDEGFYEYHDKEKEIIALLKSLQAENKALKKENKAYKEMWGELKKLVKNLRFNNEYLLQEMKNLEISGGRK